MSSTCAFKSFHGSVSQTRVVDAIVILTIDEEDCMDGNNWIVMSGMRITVGMQGEVRD